MDVRNGETYTLCTADTFLGDISGRVGKGDTLGDPGHWPNWIRKKILSLLYNDLPHGEIKSLRSEMSSKNVYHHYYGSLQKHG